MNEDILIRWDGNKICLINELSDTNPEDFLRYWFQNSSVPFILGFSSLNLDVFRK